MPNHPEACARTPALEEFIDRELRFQRYFKLIAALQLEWMKRLQAGEKPVMSEGAPLLTLPNEPGDWPGPFLLRMALESRVCRSVESFLSYVGEVLHWVLRWQPEVLRSSDMVRLEEVLKHSTMREFTEDLALRKADMLTYGGWSGMRDFLVKRLGLRELESADRYPLLGVAIATRNAIVHHRSRVNRRYLEETRRVDIALGDLVPLDIEETTQWSYEILMLVSDIDSLLIAKFGSDVLAPE